VRGDRDLAAAGDAHRRLLFFALLLQIRSEVLLKLQLYFSLGGWRSFHEGIERCIRLQGAKYPGSGLRNSRLLRDDRCGNA
jgi:hypothetical protein